MDGFSVVPTRLTEVSRTFRSMQPKPEELAGTLQGANAVQTGGQSLDASVRKVIEEHAAFLNQLGKSLGQDAEGLSMCADEYRGADNDIASRFDQIGTGTGVPTS